jgi:hypothetical protein
MLRYIPLPGRILIGAGLVLVVVLLFIGFTIGGSSTPNPCQIPAAVDGTTPTCNAPNVAQQQPMTVDLATGYDAVLRADLSTLGGSVALPRDEMTIQNGTGQMTFQPGSGKAISAWAPTTCITVDYFKILDPQVKGSYRFCFGAT